MAYSSGSLQTLEKERKTGMSIKVILSNPPTCELSSYSKAATDSYWLLIGYRSPILVLFPWGYSGLSLFILNPESSLCRTMNDGCSSTRHYLMHSFVRLYGVLPRK